MSTDRRGWHIALVPDGLVNPPDRSSSDGFDVMSVLDSCGYGALQLPPPGEHAALLAVIADQVTEYAHHGYAIVAIGLKGERADGLHWRRLAPLLRHRGIALPPRHWIRVDAKADAAAERGRLVAFLEGYDLPLEERQRWRV